MPDLLEKLWVKVINIDPEGRWMADVGNVPPHLQLHYSECAAALKRLSKLGSSEDIGQISRFVRYETCFEILSSLDHLALPEGASLDPEFLINAALTGKRVSKGMAEFVESLCETVSTEDDGQWLLGLIGQDHHWLREVGAAVNRLIKAGASTSDLGQLSTWSSYAAAEATLGLLAESGLGIPDDTTGLNELLMEAEPSGKEGGPGSWPLAAAKVNRTGRASKSEGEPLWRMRSGQAIAFSPDSKTLAVGSASGPARIFDATTGKELLTFEGIKAHIYQVAFSPDGNRLAVADIDKRLDITDARTGKPLAQVTFQPHEISGLCYTQITGEIIRSAWTSVIEVLDGSSGKKQKPLLVGNDVHSVDAITFSADGRKLLICWKPQDGPGTRVTVLVWPERKEIATFAVAYHSLSKIALSPDGRVLAIATMKAFDNEKAAIWILDASNGKELTRVPAQHPESVCFLPNGNLLVSANELLRILEPKTWKPIREFHASGSVYHCAASPDGTLLATAGSAGVGVWRI